MPPAYRYFHFPGQVAVHLYEANKLLLSCDETVNMLLNHFKRHEVTALTFKMIDKRCQAAKLTIAAGIRAMVQLLTMGRRIQMLVQCLKGIILSVTEVALIVRAISNYA